VTLAETQALFWRAMRRSISPEELAATFNGDDRLPAAGRLAIYRGMYWMRQVEALRDGFPRLLARLGDKRFHWLCLDYLFAHPSRDPRIEGVGRDLPEFLRTLLDPGRMALADLAAFEWAEVDALLSPDPPGTITTFDVPADRFPASRLVLVPSLRLLSLASDPLPDAARPMSAACFGIWRKGFAVSHVRLDEDELEAARSAGQGASVAEICSSFASAPDPPRRASTVLAAWISRRWLARVAPAGAP
jgi:hypothetical protein